MDNHWRRARRGSSALPLLLAGIAFLSGCGQVHPKAPPKAPPPQPSVVYGYGPYQSDTPQGCLAKVPVGRGRPGICAPHTPGAQLPKRITLRGPRYFVDVYEGEGHIVWSRHRTAAVVKAYEAGYLDHQFVSNWRQLVHLGRWHAAYAFLRPSMSCYAQGVGLGRRIRSVGGEDPRSGPPVADAEVPLPSGCIRAFAAGVEHVVGWKDVTTYTCPGCYPGGGVGLAWIADYGRFPPALWASHVSAWQFTSNGCYARLCGDVDLSYGLLSTVHARPRPHPHCGVRCRRLRKLEGYRRYVRRQLVMHGCKRGVRTRYCVRERRIGARVNREIRSEGR